MTYFQNLGRQMDAAEDRKTIAKLPTRQAIDTVAAWNGWELVRDEGYFVKFERGLESMTVRFSDDDAEKGRRLTNVYNQYPTGDRMAVDGRVAYAVRGMDTRDSGKREAALAWLVERHYAKPGTNALLAKVGMEPVLEEK